MKKPLRHGWGILLAAACIGLGFFALHENEAKVAAEAKLASLRQKAQSVTTQKDNAINELQTEGTLLQQKIQDADDRYQLLELERKREFDELNVKMTGQISQYENRIKEAGERIASLESKTTDQERLLDEAAGKYAAMLNDKNAEISDLSTQLKEFSAKQSALLEEKQGFETRNLDLEEQVRSLQRNVERLETEKSDLVDALHAHQTASARDSSGQ